jgi:hypothetical protein
VVDDPEEGELLDPLAVAEEKLEAARIHDGAREKVGAWLLPFSSTATGTSPSRSARSGCSSSSCPRRIAQASPAGPPPTIRTPTSIRSSGGSVGRET